MRYDKVFEKYASVPNMDHFIGARANGTAKEFPKVHLCVTSEALLLAYKEPEIYFFKDIDRIYKTNVMNGSYNFSQEAVSVDLKDGTRTYGCFRRRSENNRDSFFDAVTCLQEALAAYNLDYASEGGI